MIIKNGNVLLFKDNDVVIEKTDVKIRDGKIAKIGNNLELEDGEKVIDAKEKVFGL